MIGGPLAAALRKEHSPEASDTEINARARARIRCFATRLARFRRACLVSISEINNESPDHPIRIADRCRLLRRENEERPIAWDQSRRRGATSRVRSPPRDNVFTRSA